MPEYNTRAVVHRTGVPADTFRAWERRYGLPRPVRSGGNQRLYSERDIAVIAWLRKQTRDGLSISQAITHAQRQLDIPGHQAGQASNASDTNTEHRSDVSVQRFAPIIHRIVQALLAYDGERADQVLEEAIALLPVEQICLGVLQPALVEIGERWASGEIPVTTEHFASGFVLHRLGALFNASRPEVGNRTVLAACAEGELHEVGLLVTSLVMSRGGYRVVHLGANLPAADLRQAITRLRPDAVLLAASTEPIARRLLVEVQELKVWLDEAAPSGNPPVICIGGQAFSADPQLREGITAHYLGDDAMMALNELNRLTSGRV